MGAELQEQISGHTCYCDRRLSGGDTMAATETARERKARREQMERERLEDRRRLAEVCRQIRDSDTSTAAEKLEAIRLLEEHRFI